MGQLILFFRMRTLSINLFILILNERGSPLNNLVIHVLFIIVGGLMVVVLAQVNMWNASLLRCLAKVIYKTIFAFILVGSLRAIVIA